MATTFTWSIPANGLLTKTQNGNPDTVVSVQYKITATDGVNSVDMIQAAQLQPNANGTFIPFADLTEAQVLEWVKASLPPNQEAHFQTMLTHRLERKANPPVMPVAKAAPWSTCVQG